MVIGAGRIPPNPSELLGSQRMRDLVKQLSAVGARHHRHPPVATCDGCRHPRDARRRRAHRDLGRSDDVRHAAEGTGEPREGQRPRSGRRAEQGAPPRCGRRLLRLPIPVVPGQDNEQVEQRRRPGSRRHDDCRFGPTKDDCDRFGFRARTNGVTGSTFRSAERNCRLLSKSSRCSGSDQVHRSTSA